MKRIDKVAELLTQYSEELPVTASEISEQLSITRANVSSDLNQLVKLGKAKKAALSLFISIQQLQKKKRQIIFWLNLSKKTLVFFTVVSRLKQLYYIRQMECISY